MENLYHINSVDRKALTESGLHPLVDEQTITALFARQVEKNPQCVAVQAGNQCLTYQQLDERSSQLANHLRKQGVQEETLVPICIDRSLEMIIGLLAILKAGGAYVPIEPDYPQERLQYILSDVGGDLVVTNTKSASVLTVLTPAKTLIYIDQDWEAISQESTQAPVTALTPHNLAYVIYTSGSTGQPKGVMIEHRSIANEISSYATLFGFNSSDKQLVLANFSFDASVEQIFVPLISGACLVLITQRDQLDPDTLAKTIDDEGITHLQTTPTFLRTIKPRAYTRLKRVCSGGEACLTGLAEQWGPYVLFFNKYGPTETAVNVSYHAYSPEKTYNTHLPIGKLLPNTDICILDEFGSAVTTGEIGELYVGGIQVARGYLNRPALTANRFVSLPTDSAGSRFYKTGDLVRLLPDGNLAYEGRTDDQVKVRGYRIELGEIEYTLDQHPSVRQSVVVAREDSMGDKQLVAYVVPEKEFDQQAITIYLKRKLPDYMVPAYVVETDHFPVNNSGKTDRKTLAELTIRRPELNTLYRSPETHLERQIADLWKSILYLDNVGTDDNFFALGGNSLLAIRFVATLKEQFDYQLPIARLYQYQTIRNIAQFLARTNDAQSTAGLVRKPAGQQTDEVAVIGMAGRFPGANTIDELWTLLKEGREAIRFFTDQELDPSLPDRLKADPLYVKARGIINNIDAFDPAFFGINPKMAELMDPQQRVFLEIAWEALESAGYVPDKYDGQIGVFAGCRFNSYYLNNLSSHPELVDKAGFFNVMTVNDKDYISSRTAYALNLKGPAVTVQSACSTSLLAITQAVESIRKGQCTMALAGGASITTPINSGHLYEEGSILSNDGHCRPFDINARGTVFSDGAGVVLLKNRQLAEQDGDMIYAVIRGVGVTNDGGEKGSFSAPSSDGQAGAITMALRDANVDASSISYVEAHGTATPLGDPIEVAGLTKAFDSPAEQPFCAIGSIKSNIGHLVSAAGVAGFIKTVLSLYHKQIPPSLFYNTPNPAIDFSNSPFYVNASLADWQSDSVRRAGVSSFGVGGTNVHVIVEEAGTEPPLPKDVHARPYQLITWSAKSGESLDLYGQHLSKYCQQASQISLADTAFTLQTARSAFIHRRFIVAASPSELPEKIGSPASVHTRMVRQTPGPVVFMFPGQGSQYADMGRDLYENEPVYRSAIDECAELLAIYLETDIRQILYADGNKSADERLQNTRYTQPALFSTEYALARLWISWGIEPAILCGHSIGEFVAAHLAGVFTLADALKLISVRGQLVSELPRGSMLSVRLEAEKVGALMPEPLSIAAINSRKLCVVAGHDEDIADFASVLDNMNIPNRVLLTSHAFHSVMMEPVVADFENVLATVSLNTPTKPIISTVSGTWLSDSQATDPHYWATHLRLTVRFADALDTILAQQQPILLEVGPGNATASFARQQAGANAVTILTSLARNEARTDSESVLETLGQLWLNGLNPDWHAFYAHQNRTRIALPTYAFDKKRYWVDPAVKTYSSNGVPNSPTIDEITDESPVKQPVYPVKMRKDILAHTVRKLLEEASGIEMTNVTGDMNFLEIGFDSLLLTQLSLVLKKQFNLPITFRQLNEDYATLDALINYLDTNLPAGAYEPSVSVPQPVAQRSGSSSLTQVSMPAQAGNNPVLDLMAQQVQLLSKQIALMQAGNQQTTALSEVAPHVLIASKPVSTAKADLTPEEEVELKKPFGASARIERQLTELSPKQQNYLRQLTNRYNQKTKKSKDYTQEHRPYMADPRVVSGFKPATKELVYPIVINKSKGSRLWDLDGNEYIDMLNGFGSIMFGYQPDFIRDALYNQIDSGYEIGPQHELAGEVSRLLCEFTGHDRVALCNTGSEAVLGAMRIARTVTNRSLIVAFSGSYHGIVDEVIVRGSQRLKSFPASPGIMPEAVQNMLILEYGTDKSLAIIRERAHEIAAVLVEPVQSRRPEFVPIDFLKALRQVTADAGTALIFDEVITGFRMHPGGTQAMFGIRADLATYGKVIGGGLPIGVIAGNKGFMDALDGGFWQYGDASIPEQGVTYFAGTFVRHPLALAAAKASLLHLKTAGPALQKALTAKAQRVATTLNTEFERHQIPMVVAQFGSLWRIKTQEEVPYSELLFTLLRQKGFHIWDGFPCFITEAHTDAEIDQFIDRFRESIAELINADFLRKNHPTAVAPPVKAVVSSSYEFSTSPVPDAKLGRDRSGNPAWFIADPAQPGKYIQIYSHEHL